MGWAVTIVKGMSDYDDDDSSNRSNSYNSQQSNQDYPEQIYEQEAQEEENQPEGEVDEEAVESAFKVFDEKAVNQKFMEQLNLKPLTREQRMTYPIITKYQFAKVIGMRATQIASNSPIYIKLTEDQLKGISALDIAQLEFKEKKIPYNIRRIHPNGYYEDWQVSQLEFLCN